MANYSSHKIGLLVPIVVVSSLAVILWATPKEKEKTAFIASSLYIIGMLVGAAFALYPVVLPARDPQYSLTVENTAAGSTWPNSWPDLVDAKRPSGARLFRLHLQNVPRKSAGRRRTLLRISGYRIIGPSNPVTNVRDLRF